MDVKVKFIDKESFQDMKKSDSAMLVEMVETIIDDKLWPFTVN